MGALTPEQRAELIASYLDHGFHATKALAEAYGVQPKYLSRLARQAGSRRNYQDKGPRGPRVTDRRWRTAVERGSVVA